MARAFAPRDDCPEVPTVPAFEVDLGVNCTMPDIGVPYCEAPIFAPPLPPEPYGCPEPSGKGSITTGAAEPSLDITWTGGGGDNCNKEINIDLKLPDIVFDCTYVHVGDVTADTTFGKPKVNIKETSDIAPPDCGDTNLDFNFTFPCTDVTATTKVRDEGSTPSLTVTPTRKPGDECSINLDFDLNVPGIDSSGVCDITTNITVSSPLDKATTFYSPVVALVSGSGGTMSNNYQTLANETPPPTEYYGAVMSMVSGAKNATASGDNQTLTYEGGSSYAAGVRVLVADAGAKNGIYVTEDADTGWKMSRSSDMNQPSQVQTGKGIRVGPNPPIGQNDNRPIYVVGNGIGGFGSAITISQYTATKLPYATGTRVLVTDSSEMNGIYTVRDSTIGWRLTRAGDMAAPADLVKGKGVKIGLNPIYPSAPSGGWPSGHPNETDDDTRPMYILTTVPAVMGDTIRFGRYFAGEDNQSSFVVTRNPARECEVNLDLNLFIPKVSAGGGTMEIELIKESQTRYANNHNNTNGVKGGSGGGSGGGGGGGGGGVGDGEGIGDDRPCTDIQFHHWEFGYPPSATGRPPPDYDHPDWRSGYGLNIEDVEMKMTQPCEVSWNRRPYLQISFCRTIVDVKDENNQTVGQDCVLIMNAKPMVPGTVVRLGTRSSEASTIHIGRNYDAKSRKANGSDPILFPNTSSFTPDAVVVDEENGTNECKEPLPADEALPYPFIESNTTYDMSDIVSVQAPATHTEQGKPMVRMIRTDNDGKIKYFPENKEYESFEFEDPANAPTIKIQGGFYAVIDEKAMQDGHVILDLNSDMEIIMPTGKTCVVPVVSDLHQKVEENKVIIERQMLIFHDGIMSHLVNETEYELNTTKTQKNILRANGNSLNYNGTDNALQVVPNDSKNYDRFAFNREWPILVCETEEEESGGIG